MLGEECSGLIKNEFFGRPLPKFTLKISENPFTTVLEVVINGLESPFACTEFLCDFLHILITKICDAVMPSSILLVKENVTPNCTIIIMCMWCFVLLTDNENYYNKKCSTKSLETLGFFLELFSYNMTTGNSEDMRKR